MKTLVLSMISIAATVAAMTACTSESDGIDEVQQVAIKLNAGVIQSKSAIDSGENGLPLAQVDHVHFYREDLATETNPTWSSPTSFSGSIETSGNITNFNQYYATDGKNTHITGLYLGANFTTAPTVNNSSVTFTIDGDQDILYAAGINTGNRNNIAPSNTLNFKHKLTQFKFVAKTSSNIGAISGINVNIKDYKTTSSISLSDGQLGAWSVPVSDKNITLAAVANGGDSTPSNGIMLEPDQKSIVLEVTAENYLTTAQTLTIQGKDGASTNSFEAGKSYTITITFTGQEVTATATISKWVEGQNPDSGEIK